MSLVAFTGGFFGGLNKIAAEERAKKTALAEAATEKQSEILKYYRELPSTKEGKALVQTPGWLDANMSNIVSLGDSSVLNSLAAVVNAVDSGEIQFGNFTMKSPDMDKHPQGSVDYANAFLANFDDALFANPQAFINLKKTDEVAFNNLMSRFTRNAQERISGKMKERTPPNATELIGSIPNLGQDYKGLELEGVAEILQPYLGSFHINVVNSTIGAGGGKEGQGDPVFAYYFTPTDIEEGAGPESFETKVFGGEGSSLDFTNKPKQLQTLRALAKEVGVTPTDFIQRSGAVRTELLTWDPDLSDAENNANNQKAFIPLMLSLNPAFTALEPWRMDPNYEPKEGQRSGELSTIAQWKLGKHLNTLDNYGSKTNAMMPHMGEVESIREGADITQISVQGDANTYLEEVTGYTVEEIKSAQDNNAKALEDLGTLLKLQEASPTAGAENVLQFIAGTVGKDGFVQQLVKHTGWSNEGYTSQEQEDWDVAVNRYQREIDAAYSKNERIGRLASLRIALAFKLARAADPSGRLSNQDIEVQLRRLGGGRTFLSLDEAIGAIKQTIDATKADLAYWNQYKMIGKKSINLKDKQLIDAAIASYKATQIFREYKLSEDGTDLVKRAYAMYSGGVAPRTEAQHLTQIQPMLPDNVTSVDNVISGEIVTIPRANKVKSLYDKTGYTYAVSQAGPTEPWILYKYDLNSNTPKAIQDLGRTNELAANGVDYKDGTFTFTMT